MQRRHRASKFVLTRRDTVDIPAYRAQHRRVCVGPTDTLTTDDGDKPAWNKQTREDMQKGHGDEANDVLLKGKQNQI